MNNNFWHKLKETGQPILAVAPMAGFTDSPFRVICKSFGADVLYSEMASAAALYYGFRSLAAKEENQGNETEESSAQTTLDLLKFDAKKEKYYVVQIFGSDPEHFAAATRIVSERIKPDGIDINFGCPVGKIVKQGAGAELMKNLTRARQVVEATLKNTTLPVSVKLRIKSGAVSAAEFLKNIADLPVAAAMVHGRSLSQGFAGPADFAAIRELRTDFPGIILANGGINSLAEAQAALEISGADGLGLARGILGRPWLFQEIKEGCQKEWELNNIFQLMLEQARAVWQEKGERGLIDLRKHFPWYVQGRVGASGLRQKLVRVSNLEDLEKIIREETAATTSGGGSD